MLTKIETTNATSAGNNIIENISYQRISKNITNLSNRSNNHPRNYKVKFRVLSNIQQRKSEMKMGGGTANRTRKIPILNSISSHTTPL